jgi:CDGSH-type Zn-finger protein
MKYTAAESGRLWFCACKQTGSPPLCDGSHNAKGANG